MTVSSSVICLAREGDLDVLLFSSKEGFVQRAKGTVQLPVALSKSLLAAVNETLQLLVEPGRLISLYRLGLYRKENINSDLNYGLQHFHVTLAGIFTMDE